jgi:hypothetical protein
VGIGKNSLHNIHPQVYIDIDFDITSEFLRVSQEYFGARPQRLEFDKTEDAIRCLSYQELQILVSKYL